MKIEIFTNETLEGERYRLHDIGCALQEAAISYKKRNMEGTAAYYQNMADKIFEELEK